MKSTPDRNGPCPCGSGKKYKNCCINKQFVPSGKKSRTFIYVILIAAAFVVAGAAVINRIKNPPLTVAPVAPASAPALTKGPDGLYVQPPGPVPEGKVWSPEHGHWHDAVAGNETIPPVAPGGIVQKQDPIYTPGPPPPGPAPEGKEWSYDHGHWHNIPGYIDSKTEQKKADESVASDPQATESKPESEFIEGPFDDAEQAAGESEAR